MMSNIAFASRAVYSKAQMDKPVGENLGAANLYGILTIIAFVLSMPFFLYYELPKLSAAWTAAVAKKGAFWMWRQLFLDGLYYYAYNEVAFFTLAQVNPITHAIGARPLFSPRVPPLLPPRSSLRSSPFRRAALARTLGPGFRGVLRGSCARAWRARRRAPRPPRPNLSCSLRGRGGKGRGKFGETQKLAAQGVGRRPWRRRAGMAPARHAMAWLLPLDRAPCL